MSAQVIGYLGENGVRDVRIPIGHLLEKWQGLRPSLVMVPVGGSDDEAYPVQYTMDGTDLVWHVSDEDTAVAGTTKAAVRMVDDDGRVGMDEPFQVIISSNLSAGGEPPVVIKPWLDQLVVLVPRAEAAAGRAENAAGRAENAAQNWENGTASNSNKLGDKSPEYYLPAVQLLDNPDFAIAQAGHGGMHGAMPYAADRWMMPWGCSIAVLGGIKTLTATEWTFVQQVLWADRRDDGKTYTLAIELADGNVAVCSGTVPIDASSEVTVAEVNISSSVTLSIVKGSTKELNARITFSGSATISFKHLVMYPGTYTAETLPPFVPRPYAVELAECQWYYRDYSGIPIPFGNTPEGNTFVISLPFKMRTALSVADFSGVHAFYGDGQYLTATNVAGTSPYPPNTTERLQITLNGTIPANSQGVLYADKLIFANDL